MANGQVEPRRLIYEARLYSEQLKLLQSEMERISMTTIDLANSLSAINVLGDGEALMPIGGGAMVMAKPLSSEVLMPVGDGYLISLKKHEAAEEVRKRIKSTETAITRLRAEFDKINAKLAEVNNQIEAMNATYAQGKQANRDDYV